jgi:NAD+ synthase (glutamine-hydrolysing)
LLGVAQTAPVLRDVDANAARLAELATATAADLLLTPELSLTGYDVGDSVHRLGLQVVPGHDLGDGALREAPGRLVVGLVEAAHGGPYNAAVALGAGRVTHVQRKIHLPTYGMFDEGRWFGRGNRLDTWEVAPGWTCGVLICEDFWHPALAYVLASRGVDLLLVQAAAPGRGVWQGGEPAPDPSGETGGAGGQPPSGPGRFASAGVWERIARVTAQLYGVYVALGNRVGVEGGVTFAGGSLIVGPDGGVLARAGDAEEAVITAELSHKALSRARQPYSHARDDDPALVVRELTRALPA